MPKIALMSGEKIKELNKIKSFMKKLIQLFTNGGIQTKLQKKTAEINGLLLLQIFSF